MGKIDLSGINEERVVSTGLWEGGKPSNISPDICVPSFWQQITFTIGLLIVQEVTLPCIFHRIIIIDLLWNLSVQEKL